jgi:hypothetical protein
MGKFSQPHRTVRDIKTLAGKAEDLLTPHKMYMRLFALETERHRRQQERASAVLRVSNIDLRCAEIDQEKEVLLRQLGVESLPPELAAADPTAGPGAAAPARTPRARVGRPPRPGRVVRQTVTDPAESSSDYAPVKIRY